MFDLVVSTCERRIRRTMQNISMSFHFICLLHPANERGLRLGIVEMQKAEGSQLRKEITRSEVFGVSGYVPFVLHLHLLSLGN